MTLPDLRRAFASYSPDAADDTDARPAAVALILIDGDDGLEVLFIHRAEREGDPWSGQIAFPGGRYEPSDTDLRATAMRETREEIGVDLTSAEWLGTLSDLRPRTPLLPPIYVRPFVFALPQRPAVELSQEVQSVFWVPMGRFAEPNARLDVRLAVRGINLDVTAFTAGDRLIWGMTERILTSFLDLTRP
jgi:8-oxo-dGTP pyrophosphatase MutT (NUDIX family)